MGINNRVGLIAQEVKEILRKKRNLKKNIHNHNHQQQKQEKLDYDLLKKNKIYKNI